MTAEFRRRSTRARRSTTSCPRRSRSAARRAGACSAMRHYDVQLIGGMVLHRGGIAEMKTGEGKTLVATLPGLPERARRARASTSSPSTTTSPAATPSGWAASTSSSGMSVGIVVHGLADRERQESYRSRHHLRHQQRVRLRLPARQHEGLDRALRAARAELRHRRRGRLDPHRRGAHAAHHLGPGRAVGRPVPEGQRDHPRPAQGHRLHRRREGALGDPDRRRASSASRSGWRRQPLRPGEHRVAAPRRPRRCARTRSTSATSTTSIEEGKVIIVDEFTGRKMPGRRWSDGLHQAIEAKEGVEDRGREPDHGDHHLPELFRIYKKLAGMTGTADTEAAEFHKIYKLDVTVDPDQQADACARTPTTSSTRTSAGSSARSSTRSSTATSAGSRCWSAPSASRSPRCVASLLRKKGIPHSVLNAKQHEREAYIVAQAGRKGAVTISTNMAGRGTDIILGGNAEFMARAEVDPRERRQARRRAGAREAGRVQGRAREVQGAVRRREAGGARRRRPAHPRHRAPRVAPHRQPAARPRRPPGRPGSARASTCRSKTT